MFCILFISDVVWFFLQKIDFKVSLKEAFKLVSGTNNEENNNLMYISMELGFRVFNRF